jgi:hypothetical protein
VSDEERWVIEKEHRFWIGLLCIYVLGVITGIGIAGAALS